MAVAWVSSITPWSLSQTSATSGAFTPTAGNWLAVFGEGGNGTAVYTFSGTGSYSKLNPPNDLHDNTPPATAACGQNSSASAGSQTITIAQTGTAFTMGLAFQYSGAATSAAAGVVRSAPGTTSGAITGTAVTVPTGAILIAVCIDDNGAGGNTISSPSGTNRGSGSAGNVYCATEYAGAGGSITPSFTDTTNGGTDNYFVLQILLSPAAVASQGYDDSDLFGSLFFDDAVSTFHADSYQQKNLDPQIDDPWAQHWFEDLGDEWEAWQFDSVANSGQVFRPPEEWKQDWDDDTSDEWETWQFDSAANPGFVDIQPPDGWYDPDDAADEWEGWQHDSAANSGFVDVPPADPWDFAFDDIDDEWLVEDRPQDAVVTGLTVEDPWWWDEDVGDEWESVQEDLTNTGFVGIPPPDAWPHESADDTEELWEAWQFDSAANQGFVDVPPPDGWYDPDDIADPWEEWQDDSAANSGFVDIPPPDAWDWTEGDTDDEPWWFVEELTNTGFVDQPPPDAWWHEEEVDDELPIEEIVPEEFFEEPVPPDAFDEVEGVDEWETWADDSQANSGFVDNPQPDAWPHDQADDIDDQWWLEEAPPNPDFVTAPAIEDPWTPDYDDTHDPWDEWQHDSAANQGFVDITPADGWWWDEDFDDELAADEYAAEDFQGADQTPDDPFVEDDAGDDWWVDDYQLVDNNPALSLEDAWAWDDLDAADPWEEWQFDSGVGPDNNPVIAPQLDPEWDEVDDEWAVDEASEDEYQPSTELAPEDPWDHWEAIEDEPLVDERTPEIVAAAQPPEDIPDFEDVGDDWEWWLDASTPADFSQVQASQDEWPWEDDLDDQWEIETQPVVPDVVPPPAVLAIDPRLLRPSRRNIRFKWGAEPNKGTAPGAQPVAKVAQPSALLEKLLKRAAKGIETGEITPPSTETPRGTKAIIEPVSVERMADEDLQVRGAAPASWSALLPGLPRELHAYLETWASDESGAKAKRHCAQLRRRLSEKGQAPAEALRAVFGPQFADAPRGLREAIRRYVALQEVSPGGTRDREQRAALRKSEADLAISQQRRARREKRLALVEQLARKRLEKIQAAIEAATTRFTKIEEKLEAARKQSALVAALHKKLARAAEKGVTRHIVERIGEAMDAEAALRGIHAELVDLQGSIRTDLGRDVAHDAEIERLHAQHRDQIRVIEADMRRQRNNLLAIQTAVQMLLEGD